MALEQILSFVIKKNTSPEIRLTCRSIRLAFDSINTQLTLFKASDLVFLPDKQARFHVLFKDLVQRSRSLKSLRLSDAFDILSYEEIMEAGAKTLPMSLKTLDIECRKDVHTLHFLSEFTGLEKLLLFGCTKIANLEPLASCKYLRYLDLSDCSSVADLSPLASCSLLQKLELAGCKNVESLTPLACCKAL